MPLRVVRPFWYEGMRQVGDVWTEDDPVMAQTLKASGNCVDANWHPVIKPWPVVMPRGPMPLSGP